jgi:hypothetical protein
MSRRGAQCSPARGDQYGMLRRRAGTQTCGKTPQRIIVTFAMGKTGAERGASPVAARSTSSWPGHHAVKAFVRSRRHSTTAKRPLPTLSKPARLTLQKKRLARHDRLAGMVRAPMRGVDVVIGLADHQRRAGAQFCREAREIKP